MSIKVGHVFKPLWERFWEKVAINYATDCWEWTGSLCSKGYGHISIRTGKQVYAHRMAWEMLVGKIPEGLCLLHKCDNPKCCNPDHLIPGTNKQNSEDGVSKGRIRGAVKVLFNLHGSRVCIADIARIGNMDYWTAYQRLKKGWDVHKVLTIPVSKSSVERYSI